MPKELTQELFPRVECAVTATALPPGVRQRLCPAVNTFSQIDPPQHLMFCAESLDPQQATSHFFSLARVRKLFRDWRNPNLAARLFFDPLPDLS